MNLMGGSTLSKTGNYWKIAFPLKLDDVIMMPSNRKVKLNQGPVYDINIIQQIIGKIVIPNKQ